MIFSTSDFTIRPAAADDASALAALAQRTFIDTYGPHTDAEDVRLHCEKNFGLAQQSKEIQDPNYIVLLAYQEQELVGFSQLVKRAPPECVTVQSGISLYRYYVKKEWHGKGVAKPLLDAIEQAAKARGATHLWLGMWQHNERALAFYQKMGFTVVGRMEYHFGTKVDLDYVLQKTL